MKHILATIIAALFASAIALKADAVSVYNVTAFGANGFDGADDSAAIQRALDRAKTESVKIQFPAGTYHVNKTLVLYSNTEIELADGATVTRSSTATNRLMIAGMHLNANGTVCAHTAEDCNHYGHTQTSNVNIHGGTWDAASDGTSVAGLFRLSHGNNITIKDTKLRRATDHFVNFSGSANVLMDNVVVEDAVVYTGSDTNFWGTYRIGDPARYASLEAIHFDITDREGEEGNYPEDGTICESVTIRNCTFSNLFDAIGNHHVNSAGRLNRDFAIENCVFRNMRYYAIFAYGIVSSTISGNTCTGGREFMRADTANLTISGNSISGSTGSGIFLFAGTDCTITGNSFSNIATNGVYVVQGGNAQIDNNKFLTCKNCGVRLDSGATASVSGNVISNSLSYGICATQESALSATGNRILGSRNAGISVSGYSAGNPLTIAENEIRDTIGSGIIVGSVGSLPGEPVLTLASNSIYNSSQKGIEIRQSNVRVDGNTIQTVRDNGLYVNGGNAVISVNTIAGAAKNGILADGGAHIAANGNTITGATNDGIRLDSCSEPSLTGNQISGCGKTGIRISAANGETTISGNTIRNSSERGIYIGSTVTAQCNIADNVIDGTTSEGLYYHMSKNGSIRNNTVTGTGSFGIRVEGNSAIIASAYVAGNRVTSGSSNRADIHISDYTDGCMLAGNICGGNGISMASGATNVTYYPADATIKSIVWTDADTATVTWNNLVGVTGYFVEYSTSPVFGGNCFAGADVTDGSGTSVITGLSGSSVWYVRVRSFHVYPRASGRRNVSQGLEEYRVRTVVDPAVDDNIVYYNIRFNANGGSGTMANQGPCVYGVEYTLSPNAFTRENHVFAGWARSAGATEAEYADGADFEPASRPARGATITLYAVWETTPSYTIHYRRNDGSNFTSGPNAGLPFYEERSVDCGTEVTLPGNVAFGWSRRGMTFMGWARTQDDSKARRVWKRAGEKITDPVGKGEALDLYAVWQLNSDAYAIVFIRNEGSGFLRTVGYNRGKKAKIPSINGLEWARRGFNFKGWAKTTADARNGVVWLTDAQEIIDLLPANKTSISVYAVWEIKSAYYALKFNKNDGSGAWRSVGYEYGVNTILPTIAAGLRWERPGYKFKGWAISKANADAGKVWKKDRGTVATGIPAGTQKDIYAIWVPIAGTEVATPTATADDTAITPVLLPAGHYSGILADGTGTYDLIADAGLTGYILVNGADGIVEGECTLSVTPDSLTATLDGETIELELP